MWNLNVALRSVTEQTTLCSANQNQARWLSRVMIGQFRSVYAHETKFPFYEIGI